MIIYAWQRLVTYIVLITYVSATVSPVFAGAGDKLSSLGPVDYIAKVKIIPQNTVTNTPSQLHLRLLKGDAHPDNCLLQEIFVSPDHIPSSVSALTGLTDDYSDKLSVMRTLEASTNSLPTADINGIAWTIADKLVLHVDWQGNVLVKSVLDTQSSLRIKTTVKLAVGDIQAGHLQLQGRQIVCNGHHATIKRLDVKADNTDRQQNVLISEHSQLNLQTLNVLQGTTYNLGQITFAERGRAHFHGNPFINLGRVIANKSTALRNLNDFINANSFISKQVLITTQRFLNLETFKNTGRSKIKVVGATHNTGTLFSEDRLILNAPRFSNTGNVTLNQFKYYGKELLNDGGDMRLKASWLFKTTKVANLNNATRIASLNLGNLYISRQDITDLDNNGNLNFTNNGGSRNIVTFRNQGVAEITGEKLIIGHLYNSGGVVFGPGYYNVMHLSQSCDGILATTVPTRVNHQKIEDFVYDPPESGTTIISTHFIENQGTIACDANLTVAAIKNPLDLGHLSSAKHLHLAIEGFTERDYLKFLNISKSKGSQGVSFATDSIKSIRDLETEPKQSLTHKRISPLLFRDKGIAFAANNYPTITINLQPSAKNRGGYTLTATENGVAGKSYSLTKTSHPYSYIWGEIRASTLGGLIIDSLEPDYNYVFNISGNLSFYEPAATQGYINILKAKNVHNVRALRAEKGININALSLDNSQAVIEGGDVFINLGNKKASPRPLISLDNTHGSIVGQNSLNILAKTEILNNQGQFISPNGAAAVLSLESIYNKDGIIGANNTATVITAQKLINDTSRLFSNNFLHISAQKFGDQLSCYAAPQHIYLEGGNISVDKHSRFYKCSDHTSRNSISSNTANLRINADFSHIFASLLLNNFEATGSRHLGLYGKVHAQTNLELHNDSGALYYQPLGLAAKHKLSLSAGDGLSLTQPLTTPGQLSVTILRSATSPLKILADLKATQGLDLDANANHLEIGREAGIAPQLHSGATLNLSGHAVDILNAGIAATSKITVKSATTLKVGRSIRMHQGGKLYYRGNGTFIATLDILDAYSQSTELMLVDLMGVNGVSITAPQRLLNNGSKVHSSGNGRLQTARLINQAVVYDVNAYLAGGKSILNYGRDCLYTIGRASLHFGGTLDFVDLESGLNIASDIYAGSGFSDNARKLIHKNVDFVVPVEPTQPRMNVFRVGDHVVRAAFAEYNQNLVHYRNSLNSLRLNVGQCLNQNVISTHGTLAPQAAIALPAPSSLRANFNTAVALERVDAGVLRLTGLLQAPEVNFTFNHLIVGSTQSHKGLTALRQRQLGFKPIQALSNYMQPSQMQTLDETDREALIVPPRPLRSLAVYPDVTIITPTGFQANTEGFPRLYHPLFEMEAIKAALSDNLGRGFLSPQTRTPEEIYTKLLQNALKLRGGVSSSQSHISKHNNQLVVLTTNPDVNFEEPALVYTVTPGEKTMMLEAHIVWPKKWQQAMAKAQQITEGVIADVGLYTGHKLDVYGQLESSQQGIYDVSQIALHGDIPTLTQSTELVNPQVDSQLLTYQSRPSGMITGGKHQFTFETFDNDLGLVETNNSWFLGNHLKSTGILNLKGTTFWDVEDTEIIRLQETRYEWITESSSSSSWLGLRRKHRENRYLMASKHSYPLEVSGLFQADQLIKGAPGPEQTLFPDRHIAADDLSPVKLFTIKGGHLHVGAGGIDAKLRDDLVMLPNIDSSLQAYHSSKSNWWGSRSVSGAIQINHLIRPATISEGPIGYTMGGTAYLTAALIQSNSAEPNALRLAATNMHLGAQNLDQVMAPEVNVRKMMQSVSQIQYQQGFPSTLAAPASTIALTIDQRLDGTAPVFQGQGVDINAGELDFDINRLTFSRQTQLSGFSGLSYIKQSTDELYESAQQPLYLADDIRLLTRQGDNRQVAPQFGRSKTVTLGALGGQVLLYDAKLSQNITTNTKTLALTTPGNNVLGKLLAGDSLDKALIEADPLISQVSALTHASSSAGKTAAAVQLGVQGWRDVSNFSQAYLKGDVLKALAERYATVGIGFNRSHSETITSTALTPSLQTGIFSLSSDRGALLQGLQAEIDTAFNIDLPRLIITKSTSSTQSNSSSSGVNVGYNFVSGMPSVGYTQGRSTSEDLTHQFAHVTMGDQGVINFDQLPYLQLDGAQLVTPKATGVIDVVEVFSPQDQHIAHSSGFNIGVGGSSFTGLTGSIGGSYNNSKSRTTSKHAGLYGLTDGDLTIGHLSVTDTMMPEAMAALATMVTFTPQHDSQKSQGVSVNLSNLRLGSTEAFTKDFGNAVLIGATGIVAAEAVHALGAGDALTSLTGIAAGAGVSYNLNEPNPSFGSDPQAYTPAGVNSLGQISYSRNGKETHLVMLDVNQQALHRDMENWDSAVDKFTSQDARSADSISLNPSKPVEILNEDDDGEEALIVKPKQSRKGKEKLKKKDEAAEPEDDLDVRRSDFLIDTDDNAELYELLFEINDREPRGRSRERTRGNSGRKEDSPERIPDTVYEDIKAASQAEIASWYEARERLKKLEINDATVTRTMAAYGLDAVGWLAETADFLTGGALSWVSEKIDDGAEWVSTKVRRGVRTATDNPRLGQNTGDYVYLGLSVIGQKKVLGPAQTASKVAQTEKVAETALKAEKRLYALDLAKPKGVEITLEYMEGMNMRDFSRKARALQDLAERGKLSKAPNPVDRDKRVTARYRERIQEQAVKQWGETDISRVEKVNKLIKGREADHLQDLQIKGQDHANNLWMLEKNANQLVGRQIRKQIKDLPDHTPISSIIIKGIEK